MLIAERARLRAIDKQYYERNKASIMERRAAYAAAKAAIDTAMSVPKEVVLVIAVPVVNGWPQVDTTMLDSGAWRDKPSIPVGKKNRSGAGRPRKANIEYAGTTGRSVYKRRSKTGDSNV